FSVPIGPRLEVADHAFRFEVVDEAEVGGDLPGDGGDALHDVAGDGAPQADAVLLVDDVETVDAVHAAEVLGEKIAGAARGHDLARVALLEEIGKDDARADRVAHAFADDTVQKPHRLPTYRKSAVGSRLSAIGYRLSAIGYSAIGSSAIRLLGHRLVG